METHKDLIMPASTAGLSEMGLNPVTLSFPKDLEDPFRHDYYVNSLKMVRLSLVVGIFLYGFFGILDAELVPAMKWKLWSIRFAIVWPSLLAVIIFSYYDAFKKYFQASIMAAMIIAGFAIILMISIIPPPVNYSYYAGLILVLIWGYTFTRVRFIWATSAGWLIVAFYEVVAIWINETPISILMSNNFFFISANIAGMIACYSIEYYTRRDFYLAYQLEVEREKVRSANIRLEKVVEERTAQLVKTNQELRTEIDERKTADKKRMALEGKLQEAQKLEALGTLAGGIAHDFNNILMGIQGNASLMLLGIDSCHPNYDRIKNTEQYVLRGSELTRQLLGFARGGKYEAKPAHLNQLIDKSSQMFGRTKKEIIIHSDLHDDLWVVKVDRGHIEQVLLNLYVNAWQAMPGGGHLNLSTDNVILDKDNLKDADNHPGKYVKICVRDTGIGMNKETQKRIFDPFFTTKERGRGTGLGLASAYGIIKNHGGFFEVSSEIGKGSEFSIYLPAYEEEVVEQEHLVQEKIIKGAETILLIDDEDMIIEVTGSIIRELGYSLLTAKSGSEAMTVYGNNIAAIDLVILDMIMPDMSGGNIYDRLKKINPDVKVLLSSGYSISGDADALLKRGCDEFIQKPYDINTLSRKIRDVLQMKARNKEALSEPPVDQENRIHHYTSKKVYHSHGSTRDNNADDMLIM